MAFSRNRLTFNNEALFVSPSATGYHYTGRNAIGIKTPARSITDMAGWQCGNPFPPWNPYGTDPSYAVEHGSAIRQLRRIQSCYYGFNTNLTDINQYGHMSRLSSESINEPLVNLEFSYYLLDGFNERHIGMVINGDMSPLSQEASGSDGRNYFIEMVPESRDVVSGDAVIPNDQKTVVSIGNGFVTNYSASLAVNQIPTATVNVEAYNMTAHIGTTGVDIPSINPRNGAKMSDAWVEGSPGECKDGGSGCMSLFSMPTASKEYNGCEDVAALRPGDVVLQLSNSALISKQVDSEGAFIHGAALIESATVDFPLERTSIKRIGNQYPFTKSIDFPLTVTLTIEATLSEIKKANLVDLLCSCDKHDLLITIYDPSCTPCDFSKRKDEDIAIQFKFTESILESENFSSAIAENKSVSLKFSTQMGG